MARAALWLASEVGAGGVFTKQRLRSAFPDVAQVDRRVRDLRDEGWVIHTQRQDITLSADEQRLVTIGGHVWEKDYRRQGGGKSLTSKERQAVLARDDYCCVLCGVSGGESYPDARLDRAKLTIARLGTGFESAKFATVCDRCHRGEPDLVDGRHVRELIAELDGEARTRLVGWIKAGHRLLAAEERVWAAYRRLPGDDRASIASEMGRSG